MRVITNTTSHFKDLPFIGTDCIIGRAEMYERQAAEDAAKALYWFPHRHEPEPQGPESWRQLIRISSRMAQHRRNLAKFYRQVLQDMVL